MAGPPPDVLDLFAVPDAVEPLPGAAPGRSAPGASVLAGDLVLTPGRCPGTAEWLSPVLARLAVGLDERPGRRARDLRIAVPVPARDGSWVVQGWAATRWEPGAVTTRDPDVVLATGRLLHAVLDVGVRRPPDGLAGPGALAPAAERLAFGPVEDLPDTPVVRRLAAGLAGLPGLPGAGLGPDQLVHTELADQVALDAAGAPVVLGLTPAWRPVRWAEALCVLDTWVEAGSDPAVLAGRDDPTEREAMLRAALYRALGGLPPAEPVLVALGV